MNISMPLARLTGAALAAVFAVPLLAADAMAAKGTFQRTKPHVNVGTADQQPGDLANPQGSSAASPDNKPGAADCKPDPTKPLDAQAC